MMGDGGTVCHVCVQHSSVSSQATSQSARGRKKAIREQQQKLVSMQHFLENY